MVDRLVDQRPVHHRAAAHRRGQHPVHDAAVHVLDVDVPAQAAENSAVITTTPGVRKSMYDPVAAKPGSSTTGLEQLAEQQQPDHRLDQRDDQERRLPDQRP